MSDPTVEFDVFSNLRDRLIAGAFEHGAKLRAEVLRVEYDCSASNIREILFRLSMAGLVDFQEQRGFRVPVQSKTRRHELAEMRILLEAEGLERSINNGGVEWEARLTGAHHKLSHIESRISSTGEVEPLAALWSVAEKEFHQTLLAACGSTLMQTTHGLIYDQFRQQVVNAKTNYGYYSDNIVDHKAILDAALDRNAPLARQKVHEHLARNLRENHADIDTK